MIIFWFVPIMDIATLYMVVSRANVHKMCGLVAKTFKRNHMRIVIEEMSSWTPLTMYLRMKTTF